MIKRTICFVLIMLLVVMEIPFSVFADDSDENSSVATLSLLVISQGTSPTFTYNPNSPQNSKIWWLNTDPYSTDVNSEEFDYKAKSTNSAVGYTMSVIAEPSSSEATVKVFSTTALDPNFPDRTKDSLTGQANYNTRNPRPHPFKNSTKYYYYTVAADGSNYGAFTIRIEVTQNGVTNNYNVICQGSACNDDQVLEQIQNAFVNTVDVQTDVSAFISPAKTLIETAKPIYKTRMEAATDPMEACKIANEFNIIVCQAKAIEDEYMILNDKVTAAIDALSGIATAVQTGAADAVTAAEALSLTEYSEEDAAAITYALDELKAELADEAATPESILEKKSALDDAVNTAKLNAVKASEEATQEELDKAKEDLDKAAEENDNLRAKIAELTQAKEDAEAKLDDTEKKLDETKEKLAKAEKALIDDAAGKVVASAEKYIDAAKADLEKAAQAIAENAGAFAEDTAKKFFAKAAEAIKAATKGLEQVNGTLAEGNSRIEDLKSQLSELSETIKAGVASEAELASLNKQLKDAKDELEQAKADLAKNEGISSELEQLKAELEKANAELAKATKPEQVTANSAKAGKKKVTVKWTALDGAEGYVVYRSFKKNKGFKAVKTIKKAKTVKFTDKKVKKGKKYFYKVRAYKMYDGNKLFGAYSKVLKTAKVK